MILVARLRQWRAFAFPLVMLGTTLAVHLLHRPWWMYYYLHQAIPLAWLAGFAVNASFEYLTRLLAHPNSQTPSVARPPRAPFSAPSRKTSYPLNSSPPAHQAGRTTPQFQFNLTSPKAWQGLGIAALLALVLVRSESRLEGGIKDLRQRDRVADNPIDAQMRAHASQTHWVYVPFGNEIYPFQAGLPMPPELALVTLKRFWSGQITDAHILELCRWYHPEQILLKPESVNNEWRGLLGNYSTIYQGKNFNFYLLK